MASTSSKGSCEVCNVCGVGNDVLRRKRGKHLALKKVPSGSIVIPPTVPPEQLQGAKPNLLCPKDYNLNMTRQNQHAIERAQQGREREEQMRAQQQQLQQ
jgi:hypothetical protein